MKKILLTTMLLFGTLSVFAQDWICHTTCGTSIPFTMADNASTAQIKAMVIQINEGSCGATPVHVFIEA